MSKLLATLKAIITRLVFACHGIIAIWQVTRTKNDNQYWYLLSPTLLLFFEGLFTLTIKDNQEWKWFCPSVFLYLANVVPAIWLLELDKVEERLSNLKRNSSTSPTSTTSPPASTAPDHMEIMLGNRSIIAVPDLVNSEIWVTLVEQFLMLTLIVGRWLLPKGDLTRDQLSQLLLVYIGTAADIIEFFDSFKDDTIVSVQLLVFLTLSIWSWSLLQFTIVLSATKSRKSRGTAGSTQDSTSGRCCCCSIDACAIAMNIALQDAPFLVFRLLIILHYKIISYMNVFFTCKNTLVILLQVYRLYVVHSEARKESRKKNRAEAYRKAKKHHQHVNRKHEAKNRKSESKHRKRRRGSDDVEAGLAIVADAKRMYDLDGSKIRAFILTNGEDLQELELSKLFMEKIVNEGIKVKDKNKSKTSKHREREAEAILSEDSSSRQNHNTDDSGI